MLENIKHNHVYHICNVDNNPKKRQERNREKIKLKEIGA